MFFNMLYYYINVPQLNFFFSILKFGKLGWVYFIDIALYICALFVPN